MQKEKREIIYAIVTILAIPLLILANTLYIVSSVRHMFSVEFSEKADLLNTAMAESLKSDVIKGDSQSLSKKLNDLHDQQPVLTRLQVLKEQNGQIVSVANSKDSEPALSSGSTMAAKIVYEKNYPVSRTVKVFNGENYTHAWSVSTPITDSNKVVAVLNSTILPGESESIINKNLYTSIIFVVVTIFIIFVLLFRHFRFAEYGRLLAKQKEINQTMSNFLSVATHELKAPMTIIKGYISNAMDDPENPLTDSTKQQLNVALNQTDSLNHLVKDLLNVSRIEQGRIEYNILTFDLNTLMEPIIRNYEIVAKDKNITITKNLGPNLIVKADQERTQEIFTNLIDNAVKYSFKGSITISQQSSNKFIAISVRDNGIGMNSEQRQQLFQRFYRIKTDQTKEISGTGLGLWIIKQYIEAMGGTIEVNSMEGVGSEFIVYIPKA